MIQQHDSVYVRVVLVQPSRKKTYALESPTDGRISFTLFHEFHETYHSVTFIS